MNDDIPPEMQVRRDLEDRLIQLGRKRREVEQEASENVRAITEALAEASVAHIPIEHVAQLVGVSRQTLYRWRDEAG